MITSTRSRPKITYTTDSVIFLVISRLLNVVPSDNSRISMIVVACVGCEIDFSKKFLLMMLEFSDHLGFMNGRSQPLQVLRRRS
jgi:hypothetical protein